MTEKKKLTKEEQILLDKYTSVSKILFDGQLSFKQIDIICNSIKAQVENVPVKIDIKDEVKENTDNKSKADK